MASDMDDSHTPTNPTPKSKNSFLIGGLTVQFPYQPYGTQLAFMNRVISTLDRAQREGHCHALLESPTGTGKSLSLLCSTLAWQQNQKLKNIRAKLTHSTSRPNPEAVTDPVNHGGGFIPETQPSGNPETQQTATNSSKNEKSRLAPTIFYSSRTHTQISQVIREYKKTSYRIPMAILGSRKHYCTNPYLRGDDKVDEQCKLLLKNREDTCPEFKNVHKVKGHPSLQKGGCHEIHDIEDLVKIGQVVKGCSYFAARSMAQEAELVFCPYNYVLNPIIRDAMEIDISGSIIILDEAHNIEDIARDAGSFDLDEEALLHLQTELGQLSFNEDATYQPLFEMTQEILSWMDGRKNALQKHEFQHYFRCWTGDKALKELQQANISLQSFPILQECAKKAIRAASEAESDVAHLSGMAAATLEGLFCSLSYFFSGNGAHANDYELSLQKFVKKDEGGWVNMLSLWCLNPAVVFKNIAASSQSVILTSGTLSPMNTFSSELGIHFGTCLEAPHVIDVNSQVWAAAIATGPGNYPLNASYKTADDYGFQDTLGTSLEEICKAVPSGCLVFFPSYKLLDKVCKRWKETGQWSHLNAQKSFFIEPRGSSQDSFESVLKDYYNTIHQGTRQMYGRRLGGKKLGLKNGKLAAATKDNKKDGAAFLAVCRGKVSEGMDFSDDNARVVVIVGIPFPNMYDIKVAQKKKFNDCYEFSKNLLNGNEWYCHQAFRALNQATGRCIRHKFDYGAIIFLDERFHKDRNRAYISKWLRKSIRLYNCFEESMEDLKSFFRDVKVHTGLVANSSQDLDVDHDNIKPVVKNTVTRKTANKVTKSSCQPKLESNNIFADEQASVLANPSLLSANCYSPLIQPKSEVLLADNGDAFVCREYIDLECDTVKDLRYSATPLVLLPSDDLELTVVKETPGIGYRSPETNSEFVSNDVLSTPRRNNSAMGFHQQSSFQSTLSLQAGTNCTISSAVATPEKEITSEMNSMEPAASSSWSVNSDIWKKRKINGLSSVGPLHEFSRTLSQVHNKISPLVSSMTTADATHMAERINYSGNECGISGSCLCTTPKNSDRLRVSAGSFMDDRLKIFCLCCKNPLGLPENDNSVALTVTTTSKVHLISLWKKMLGVEASSSSTVDVLVCDVSSINQHVSETAREGASGQGVWCKDDGCVFNSIFCPFCPNPDRCLGVHVAATDASNGHFQNKVLFFVDCLEIQKCEAETKQIKVEPTVHAFSLDGDLKTAKDSQSNDIEKFAYTSPVEDSGGWRKTKSRMQLPKKKW